MHDSTKRMKTLRALVENAWENVTLPNQNNQIIWEPRLTDPLPKEWPMKDQALVIYAYARGRSADLKDAEYAGPVWAEIDDPEKPELILRNRPMMPSFTPVGLRPLNRAEIEILKLDPFALFQTFHLHESRNKLITYYSLQKSLGNFPDEIVQAHASFFKLL